MLAEAVYVVGALVTLLCGVLLMRGYMRTRRRLLLWSALCFLGLSLSNGLVFVDLVLLPYVDLYRWRLVTAAIAMVLLLYGLIWEGEN
jgi:Family of unknown function (DUF5985)